MSESHTQLAFQTTGPQNSSTIVFLYGGGAGMRMWQPVVDHLTDYHCRAPDQPEHGGSRNIKPFSMALAAEKNGGVDSLPCTR